MFYLFKNTAWPQSLNILALNISALNFLATAFLALTLLLSSLLIASPANAASVDARFYHMHKRDGQVRIRAKNTDETGCHNFGWRNKGLHRMAQIGFSWCSVYSEADCPTDKTLAAKWDGKKYRLADIDISQPQTKLLRGTQWVFAEKNIKAKSWRCEK